MTLISLIRHSFAYCSRGIVKLAVLVLYYIVADVLVMAMPLVAMYVIDDVIGQHDIGSLAPVIIAMIVVTLVIVVMNGVMGYLMGVWDENIVQNAQSDLFRHYMSRDLLFFRTHHSGQLASHFFGALPKLMAPGVVSLSRIVGAGVRLFVGLGIMLYLSSSLAVIALAVVPLMLVPLIFFGARIDQKSGTVQMCMDTAYAEFQEAVNGVQLVKQCTQEGSRLRRMNECVSNMVGAKLDLARVQTIMSGTESALLGFGPTLILWLGAVQVIEGRITLGVLIAVSSYLGYLYSPIGELILFVRSVRQSRGALKEIDFAELVASKRAELPYSNGLKPIRAFRLEAKSISFAYSGGRPLFANWNHEFRGGDAVRITGPTGTGKTTLAAVLAAYYRPTGGTLLLNGEAYDRYEPATLRRTLYLVNQDTFLFSGTVMDNLLMMRTDIDRATVEKTLDDRGFARVLSGGVLSLDAKTGQGGMQLSRGQRQIVSMMQAFLADPQVLVLDEATASLSAELELNLMEAVVELMSNRILIFISHRDDLSRFATDVVDLQCRVTQYAED